MQRGAALAVLRDHAEELRALGVLSVSLFGSTARDEATETSDVDIAVRLTLGPRGFPHIGRMERLRELFASWLGTEVDVIEEPSSRRFVQAEINRDRCCAF